MEAPSLPSEAKGYEFKTFWRRLGAMFLDGAAFVPLGWVDQLLWNSTSSALLLLPWVVIYSLIPLVYEVLFVTVFGQTLGKMACGVRIHDVRGGPVSLRQAVLRHIVPIITMPYFAAIQIQNIVAGDLGGRAMGEFSTYRMFFIISICWVFIEIVTMLTNRKRRALHDFIAGTVVVRENRQLVLLWCLLGLMLLNFVMPWLPDDQNLLPKRTTF